MSLQEQTKQQMQQQQQQLISYYVSIAFLSVSWSQHRLKST
jgi:hypothetical protein